jgi:hypothetical protein
MQALRCNLRISPYEADLSAQEAQAQARSWFSRPHAYPHGAAYLEAQTRQGTQAPVDLSVSRRARATLAMVL